jgi:hypothetical protein
MTCWIRLLYLDIFSIDEGRIVQETQPSVGFKSRYCLYCPMSDHATSEERRRLESELLDAVRQAHIA